MVFIEVICEFCSSGIIEFCPYGKAFFFLDGSTASCVQSIGISIECSNNAATGIRP